MGKVKELFGVEPKLENEEKQVYSPSKSALKMAVKSKTDYEDTNYDVPFTEGDRKILILGTEVEHLRMQNGKSFLTGNHPVELFVPMLHWQKAGFEFDFVTLNGESIKLEKWALPKEDAEVMQIYHTYKERLRHPKKLGNVLDELTSNSDYVGVFIPGGHGAIGDLPQSPEVKKLLQWVMDSDRYLISICHGPAAFLSAALDNGDTTFMFNGYEIAAFPDSNDKLLPTIGYLPGKLPWFFGNKLNELGVDIVNNMANGTVHQDRKVITGDSPNAANELGKLSARLLLKEVEKTMSV